MISNPLYLGATDGMGFPNLPAPGSGGGSGDGLKIAAGDAIKISRITISDISYSRIGVKTDDETITVDELTNKLKVLVKGLKDFSSSEVALGIKWVDNKYVYLKCIPITLPTGNDEEKVADAITGADSYIYIGGAVHSEENPLNSVPINTYVSASYRASVTVGSNGNFYGTQAGYPCYTGSLIVLYTK